MAIRRRDRRRLPPVAAALAVALALCALAPPALSAGPDEAASKDDAPAPPKKADPAIALVLPVNSGTYGRAADAVKAGFLAAAAAANEKPEVIAHGDGDVEAAFAKARASGARVIVGPLVRDDVRAVTGAGFESPLILVLNQLDDGAMLPPNVYALSLAVESDARQLARIAHDAGAQAVAVVGDDTPLQKRFATAFVDAWLLAGGSAPVMLRFDRSPDGLALLKRELGRTPVDAVLLAVDGADAHLVKPYLGTRPAYAGSTVSERQPRESMRDLEDVRFVDIPWLATPEAREFARIARADFPNATLDRLYALGIDAFRVAQLLADGRLDRIEFDGATGHLTLEATRQFARDAYPLQFKGGQVVPAAAR
jgi:outer membrane PBP1 activator LpoA protein